jgi:hypothetical protein
MLNNGEFVHPNNERPACVYGSTLAVEPASPPRIPRNARRRSPLQVVNLVIRRNGTDKSGNGMNRHRSKRRGLDAAPVECRTPSAPCSIGSLPQHSSGRSE